MLSNSRSTNFAHFVSLPCSSLCHLSSALALAVGLESASFRSARLRQHSMASEEAASRHWGIGIGSDGMEVEDAAPFGRHSLAQEDMTAATACFVLRSAVWEAEEERATLECVAAVVKHGNPGHAARWSRTDTATPAACFAWAKCGNATGACPPCHQQPGLFERHGTSALVR